MKTSAMNEYIATMMVKPDHVSELSRTALKLESFSSDNSYSGVLV